MRYLLVLCLFSGGAMACDWEVSKETDSMTDATQCYVSSPNSAVVFYRNGSDRPNVVAPSTYSRPAVYVRVDDNEAVRMGDNAWDRQKALSELLPQLETGKRLRTRVEDYPNWREGDTEICNLPELLRECGA